MASELTIDTAALFRVMDAVMPRPLRIHYAGARYHVMIRGDRLEAIFVDDADRVEFLRTLGQACLKSDRLRIGSASYVSNLLSVSIVSSDSYSPTKQAEVKRALKWFRELGRF